MGKVLADIWSDTYECCNLGSFAIASYPRAAAIDSGAPLSRRAAVLIHGIGYNVVLLKRQLHNPFASLYRRSRKRRPDEKN